MSFKFDFLGEGEKLAENLTTMKGINNDRNLMTNCSNELHKVIPILDMHTIPFSTITINSMVQFKKVINESNLDNELDIISGKYEGGLKIWECSYDLTNYLLSQVDFEVNRKDAIEIGCGHGFPGISALKLGFEHVIFSDLNDEVLREVTWKNILLNCSGEWDRAECFSGNWLSLSDMLSSR